MIPTQPSDRIEDFIAFVAAMVGPEVAARRMGACKADIDRYETLCRHPLPKLLRDFLAEFGESDGGADLGFGVMPRMEPLLDHYEWVDEWERDGLEHRPLRLKGGLVIALDDNLDELSLVSASGDFEGDAVVCMTGETFCGETLAASLANFLYASVFASAWFSSGIKSLGFGFADPQRYSAIVAAAVAFGCKSYWFSDDFCTCLEFGLDALQIRRGERGVGVNVVCHDPGRHQSFVKLFHQELKADQILQL